MRKSPVTIYKFCSILFFLNLIFFGGCRTNESGNANNSKPLASNTSRKNPPSDDVEGLLDLIKLPIVPDEVVWCEVEEGGKRKLTAVLRYSEENDPKILELMEKYKQPDQAEVDVENWFPEELTALAQLSGVETIKGISYSATEFFNIPYGSGRITRIEGTKYFVLELQAN